jgi:hypothetical protein
MFCWREVIEWRKLASRNCALGAGNIADFNGWQPFSVCASLEVESVSYSRRREGVPRTQLREWAAPTDSSSEELGNNSCSGRRAKSQSCLLLIELRNRDTSSECRPASDVEALELAGLQAPLSTLRLEPRDASRMTRGHQRKDHQDRRPIFKCALNRQFAAH